MKPEMPTAVRMMVEELRNRSRNGLARTHEWATLEWFDNHWPSSEPELDAQFLSDMACAEIIEDRRHRLYKIARRIRESYGQRSE